mmetsp:Transcript_63871/g.126270  ORF Transcript_63871/g.126270 Transcript_63871/m.126270 type:complete len:300 (+) Transcript_63871:1891-2790(+)
MKQPQVFTSSTLQLLIKLLGSSTLPTTSCDATMSSRLYSSSSMMASERSATKSCSLRTSAMMTSALSSIACLRTSPVSGLEREGQESSMLFRIMSRGLLRFISSCIISDNCVTESGTGKCRLSLLSPKRATSLSKMLVSEFSVWAMRSSCSNRLCVRTKRGVFSVSDPSEDGVIICSTSRSAFSLLTSADSVTVGSTAGAAASLSGTPIATVLLRAFWEPAGPVSGAGEGVSALVVLLLSSPPSLPSSSSLPFSALTGGSLLRKYSRWSHTRRVCLMTSSCTFVYSASKISSRYVRADS